MRHNSGRSKGVRGQWGISTQRVRALRGAAPWYSSPQGGLWATRWSAAWRRTTGLAKATAAVDVDVTVDRVLVDQAGVWGRGQQRGQDVGPVNGDSLAVRPGNTSQWLLRWRSVRQPCALATKASRGSHREQWSDRGGQTGRVGAVNGGQKRNRWPATRFCAHSGRRPPLRRRVSWG